MTCADTHQVLIEIVIQLVWSLSLDPVLVAKNLFQFVALNYTLICDYLYNNLLCLQAPRSRVFTNPEGSTILIY